MDFNRSWFEMGLGVIEVVRVLQEKSGDAKSSFDFENGQEGDLALTYGLQTFHRLSNLPLLLVHVRQSPQSLRHRFHLITPSPPIIPNQSLPLFSHSDEVRVRVPGTAFG